MSEINSENTPPKKSNKVPYIILLILLIGANVFLYINNSKNSTALETVITEKNQLDSTYKQLEHDYKKTLAELEDQKGKNAELDKLLQEKIQALQTNQNEMKVFLGRQNLSKKELERAKELINQLKHEQNDMQTKYDDLQQQFTILTKKYDTATTELHTTKEKVKGLESENATLGEVARTLHVSNIVINGEKEKGKGKEKLTNSVRHLDYIRISFDVEKNNIIDAGNQTIYYRIASPENKLLYNPNKDGGIMTAADKTEIRYTGKAEFSYNKEKTPISIKFTPDAKLMKGKYQVEFYQNGTSIGTESFTLNASLL
jgi:predicted nuclease with TOPRIM domain